MILHFVRTWLPAIIVLLGIGLWVADPTVNTAMGSAGIIGAGIGIWLLNVLFRVGVKGDLERDEEDAARRYFDEHGHWPDEQPADDDAAARQRHRQSAPSPSRAPRRPS